MSLYHTYRPQTFADIVEQAPIVTTLTNQIKLDKVAHAYIFSGPRGVGKTTTARVLAKAINCEQRQPNNAEPCNHCTICQEITDGRALDVIEIDAASHTGVDNVRQNIIENAQFQPTRAKNKVFIIDEVHMLSTAAFNALLKTIEEPPAHVVFILATTETQKIPATILSRCQRFMFKKVPADILTSYLDRVAKQENMSIEPTVLERIGFKSDGCVRDGLSLLDQLAALGLKTITAHDASLILPIPNREAEIIFLDAVTAGNSAKAIQHLREVADTGISLPSFADGILELSRLCMLIKADPSTAERELIELAGFAQQLESIAQRINLETSVTLLDTLSTRVREVRGAHVPTLPLELFAISWAAQMDHSIPQKQINQSQTPSIPIKAPTPPPTETPTVTTHIPAAEPSEPKKNEGAHFTKTDVENIWPQFLNHIDTQFHSLSFLLKMAKLIRVEAPIIAVAVPYNFHQEKLSEKMSQHNIQKILSPLLQNQPVQFIAELDATAATAPQNPELENLASAFGGHVI